MANGKDAYKVGITGSYGGLNLGDEAILQSIVAQLRRDLPVEITVFSRDAEDTRRRHGVERSVPVRKLSRAEVTPEIERLDLLILGGGGILYDADARTYLRGIHRAREGRAGDAVRDRRGAAFARRRHRGGARRARARRGDYRARALGAARA